jgi:hypothetical protein
MLAGLGSATGNPVIVRSPHRGRVTSELTRTTWPGHGIHFMLSFSEDRGQLPSRLSLNRRPSVRLPGADLPSSIRHDVTLSGLSRRMGTGHVSRHFPACDQVLNEAGPAFRDRNQRLTAGFDAGSFLISLHGLADALFCNVGRSLGMSTAFTGRFCPTTGRARCPPKPTMC